MDFADIHAIDVAGVKLQAAQLATLKPGMWLVDDVVVAYLKCVAADHEQTAYIIHPDAFVMWSSGKFEHYIFPEVEFTQYKFILVPICIDHHWVLIVANVEERKVGIMYSLRKAEVQENLVLTVWDEFMHFRSMNSNKQPMPQWTHVNIKSNKQHDGSSCGVFVMMYADCMMKDEAKGYR
jgi:Ulp1 family protease